MLTVDVNCDGVADRIFTGREADRFHVAAVLGPISESSRVSFRSFFLSGDSQDSFCGPPTMLSKERLDYDPMEAIGAIPAGFRQSAGCHGLRLVAGECDSFHFFWNHSDDALAWWRL